MVEDHPSEFPAAKAPMVEGLAQGGSAVAPLAVGALEEVALGAHQVAMEAASVGAMGEAASVGAMEEAASGVAALVEAATAEAASVEATSVEAATEGALVVDTEEMVAAFSPEMKK